MLGKQSPECVTATLVALDCPLRFREKLAYGLTERVEFTGTADHQKEQQPSCRLLCNLISCRMCNLIHALQKRCIRGARLQGRRKLLTGKGHTPDDVKQTIYLYDMGCAFELQYYCYTTTVQKKHFRANKELLYRTRGIPLQDIGEAKPVLSKYCEMGNPQGCSHANIYHL